LFEYANLCHYKTSALALRISEHRPLRFHFCFPWQYTCVVSPIDGIHQAEQSSNATERGFQLMSTPLYQYFCCADLPFGFSPNGPLSEDPGFFRFGPETLCYGRSSTGFRSQQANQTLYDVLGDTSFDGSTIRLPFDPLEVVENLRSERYVLRSSGRHGTPGQKLIWNAYYLIRPLLSLAVRKHLHRIHLSDWDEIPFPRWPVDTTVDDLLTTLLVLVLKSNGTNEIPFIWFWPDGADACSIMTHDVEAEPGKQFISRLMDMDEAFRIPASFQIVPEKRYTVEKSLLENIRSRGFEVNVQDLDHDGRLFQDKNEFAKRARKINQYAREYRAVGFRSAILYRNQDWYHLLDFEYDMSIPNVAHLDPQRGGCCTVMPYFIGSMVELPVTTTQDHSLFNVLNDHSLDLWKQQTEMIIQQHGLLSFIIHPDYIIPQRAQQTYKSLLQFLETLRTERNVWIARPDEVNRWWRQRNQMTIVQDSGRWVIQGPGHERARLAFATLDGDRVAYKLSERVGAPA
jgi:hypothetical protein